MTNENLLVHFPQRRLRPYDGMAITAEVWEQAHSYHDQALRAHNLAFHGAGILYGLEVIASDPPDQMIYILPGAAVDANGQAILLQDAVAYDIGSDVEGSLYLYITHRESAAPAAAQERESGPQYVDDQFLISARSSIPEQAGVLLARIVRSTRQAPIHDAADPLRPGDNEIDLRSRPAARGEVEEILTAGVIYLGSREHTTHGSGLARASHEIRKVGRCQLVVDDDVQLGPNAARYSLLYLAGNGAFQLSAAQTKGLQGFLERGGTLLLEAGDEAAKGAFIDLCSQIAVGLTRLSPDHPLLNDPYLFNAAPAGFEKTGEVLAGEGVILSTWNYGRLWAGERPEAGRETLRASIEWMVNLLRGALERRRAVQS